MASPPGRYQVRRAGGSPCSARCAKQERRGLVILTCDSASDTNAVTRHRAGGTAHSCISNPNPPTPSPETAARQSRQLARKLLLLAGDTHMKLLFPQPGGPYSR